MKALASVAANQQHELKGQPHSDIVSLATTAAPPADPVTDNKERRPRT